MPQQDSRTTAPPPSGIVRSIALASIGLISMLGDRVEEWYERSTQRQTASMAQRAADEWEATLTRLKLPTKSDLDALSRQMTALEQQIDQLIAQHSSKKDT